MGVVSALGLPALSPAAGQACLLLRGGGGGPRRCGGGARGLQSGLLQGRVGERQEGAEGGASGAPGREHGGRLCHAQLSIH